MELFEIEVEYWDEEIEVVDSATFLEDAILIAKSIPIESYKAIGINQLSPDGRIEIVFDIDGEILDDKRNNK